MRISTLLLERSLNPIEADEMGADEDPIASDPHLLYVWTRYVGILIALLVVLVGASDDSIDLSALIPTEGD